MPVERAPVRRTDGSSSVAEVVSVILDKGIVIDAWVRAPAERALVRQTYGWVSVSVLGLDLLTIQARVVVASVETYLRYAEAIELTALVAPPRGQQVAPGRGKEQAIGGPSEDEVLRDLSEHPEGLPLEAMQARLDAPLERSDDILSHLLEERKVHRDADASLQRRRH